MPAIKHIAENKTFQVAANPVLVDGIWECGDRRFTDPAGDQYTVVNVSRPALTPMEFYLAFTPTERMAIKASNDEMVKEFWATYQLAVQLGASIDPNLVSVEQGIGYLAQAGILASQDRVAQILAGVPQ